MTLDQLRIAVAESLGWHSIHHGGISPLGNTPDMVRTVEAYQKIIPNYPTSLDACREGFEKDAPEAYWQQLDLIASKDDDNLFQRAVAMAKSTPEQRCRAWLAFVKERKV